MDSKTGYAKKAILIIFLVVLSLSIIIPVKMYNDFLVNPASAKGKDIEVRIHKGTSSSTIIDELYKNGLIKNKFYARLYLKKLELDRNLKVGVYKFNTSMTPVEIFNKLQKGELDPDIVYVTIPEGYTIKQIADKLYQAGLVSSADVFINEAQSGVFDFSFVSSIPKSRPSRLEGYLFPDTYELKKGTSAHDIIKTMLSRFNSIYSTLTSNNGNVEKKDMDNIIIMASIIESEAKLDSERPVIASVFYNRLKINMLLQSCATVEYSLGTHKDVLYYKDLQVDSPYNTYKYKGLPAGPICNPGKPSIEAALNPSSTDYLYFVAKGDGSHYFTKDYNDFLNFQKKNKK